MTTSYLLETDGGAGGAADHGALLGLGDDDHAQYLLLLGRATGQTAIGGTAAGEELVLRGTSNANLGQVRFESAIDFDDVSAGTALNPYVVRDASNWGTYAPAFIGGVFSDQRTVEFTNVVYVYESMRGAPFLTKEANDGFSAFALFQGLPILASGTGAGHNPLQALVLNAAPQLRHHNTGTRTTTAATGVNFQPTLNTRFSNAQTLNVTSITAVAAAATFNTNAGTTVSFGTFRGLHARNIVVASFGGSGAGTETLTAYYALDMDNVAFGGNVSKAAVRSALAPASNAYFLLNTGGAQSDFGGSDLFDLGITQHLGDGVGFSSSYGAAGGDITVYWDGASFVTNPIVGDNLLWTFAAGSHTLTSSGSIMELRVDCLKFAFGQTGAVGNQKGVFVANAETVTIGGDFSQYLLTQAANDTIDAALGLYAGWTINAPTPTIGTGSLTTGCALNIGGNPTGTTNRVGLRIISNPSGASTVNAALWVTAGLSLFDGRVDINNPIALGGGAGATLGTIGATGPTTAAQAQWVEIDVGGTPHWIAVWT